MRPAARIFPTGGGGATCGGGDDGAGLTPNADNSARLANLADIEELNRYKNRASRITRHNRLPPREFPTLVNSARANYRRRNGAPRHQQQHQS